MTYLKKDQNSSRTARPKEPVRLLAVVEYRPAERAAKIILMPSVDARFLLNRKPLPTIIW